MVNFQEPYLVGILGNIGMARVGSKNSLEIMLPLNNHYAKYEQRDSIFKFVVQMQFILMDKLCIISEKQNEFNCYFILIV